MHLKRIGDYVETFPITHEDATKMKFAAHAWAFHVKKRVKFERFPAGEGMVYARVTLISQHRIRDYS